MLAKHLFQKSKGMLRAARPCQRYFSATDASAEEAKVPEPTKEEIEANRAEWGIKYNDECLKFEKEWEIIAQRVQDEQ